jgi:subtilisin family serine protease
MRSSRPGEDSVLESDEWQKLEYVACHLTGLQRPLWCAKKTFRSLAGLLIVFTLFCVWPAEGRSASSGALGQAPIQGRYAEGEVLVQVKTGLSRGEVEAIFARYGMTILRAYRAMPQLFHVRLPEGLTVEAAITALKADAGVESAEPNDLVEPQSACPAPCSPNDSQYPNQWGLANIRAEGAWGITHGSSDVIVAILDTGLDRLHPDLQDNAWTNPADPLNGVDDDGDGYIDDYYGYDATASLCPTVPCRAGDPMDDDTSVQGHGTRLAGIIGAVGNNGRDIAGVNWHAKILPIKIRREPDRQSSLDLMLAGFDYLIAKRTLGVPISVAHLSFLVSSYSSALQAGIDAVRDAGILIIWSAGNGGENVDADATDFYAHAYDNVLFVGAIDLSNELASFSSYGQVGVHLAAPGVGILSTVRSAYTPLGQADDGTSYSAPFVTGVAALLAAWNPALTYTQLKARIMSATTRTDGLVGKVAAGGRLNAAGVFTAPITDLTPAGYQLARTEAGHRYYLDRTFTVTSIPQGFDGLWWVRTRNNDKAQTAANFLRLGLGQEATVYVAYDPRAAKIPDWLSPAQGWTATEHAIGVAGDPVGTLRLYAKPFRPSMVVLGGNQAPGYVNTTGNVSNYVVLVGFSAGNADTDGPSDTRLDGYDLVKFNLAVGSSVGSPNWCAACDLDTNGTIDALDVSLFMNNFGKSL